MTLVIFGLVRGKLSLHFPKDTRLNLALTGALLASHWLSFFWSVQLYGVAIATLTFATFPMFTAVIEAARAARKPKLIEIAASTAIIVAVALLVDFNSQQSTVLIGALSGLASAVTFAFFGVSSKTLTTRLTPLTLSIAQNAIVAVLLLPTLFFASPAPTLATDWLCLILLGVVTTALMHQLYLFALTKLSATTCSGFIALEPAYAVAFAALFFGEPITLWVVVSGCLILGASLLLLRSASTAAH